jgi:hypothetical protein
MLEHFSSDLFHFDEDTHTYTFDGRVLKSVTGVCKRFHKPFERDAISKRVAEREGRPQEEVLAEWDAKAKRATDLGTEVHKLIETYWDQGLEAALALWATEEAKARFAAFVEFRMRELPTIKVVAQELKVYNLAFGMAGMIDFVGINDKQDLFIFDWKTNGKFTTDSDKAYDMLRAPLTSYPDNHLNAYSIQLSLYRLMLDKAGIDIKNAYLVHIPPNGAKPKMHKAKDFREDLQPYLRRV